MKYIFTLLKVLASIIGLLVAIGTSVLVLDAASIRTGGTSISQTVDVDGNVHLSISITLTSAAYVFEARNGNLTLVLKTNRGEFVDKDTALFNLSKGEIKNLTLELVIPQSLALEVEAGTVRLFIDIYLSFWEAYSNFQLLKIGIKTTIEITPGG